VVAFVYCTKNHLQKTKKLVKRLKNHLFFNNQRQIEHLFRLGHEIVRENFGDKRVGGGQETIWP